MWIRETREWLRLPSSYVLLATTSLWGLQMINSARFFVDDEFSRCENLVDVQRNLNSCYSTASFDGENEKVGKINEGEEELDDEFFTAKPELQPQGVDPRRGWGFRGVHKAIICGKIGQAPVQKILRNGQTVTIFTVGTGGMFDQRIVGSKDLPKPAQWHRIAVHNELLGAYAVQQLVKNSSVYVEGDIETRVYNDSINGEVKNVPEICVRRDGKIHLMKSGESISNISFEELLAQVSALVACPKCGRMEVPYPLSTSDGCGNSSYRVYCNSGILEFLSAGGFYYKILSINPKAYKFIISPPLILNNTCYSSDLTLGGLTLDENSPFNISTHNTVMLLNCSENILLSPLNCSSNSPCRQFEEMEQGSGCKDTLCCSFLKDSAMTSHRIRVRVGGCTAYTSVVDLKPGASVDSWNFGIELQWLPSN
ncbi:hypothetical protein L1049_019709 [Liquidambar formosana]|uniref:Wall-associated receptor kinase galacturonan-binding domain-containing protein n=1 Tax=Liquidambar formosana TaxID=63359 RepID=A0AAP0X363_LIQFO